MIKRKNDMSLGEALKLMLKNSPLKKGLYEATIRNTWKSQMGAHINQYTKDLQINQHTVIITVVSAPLRQELAYGRDKIKKLFNDAIGEEYIQEVIIK